MNVKNALKALDVIVERNRKNSFSSKGEGEMRLKVRDLRDVLNALEEQHAQRHDEYASLDDVNEPSEVIRKPIQTSEQRHDEKIDLGMDCKLCGKRMIGKPDNGLCEDCTCEHEWFWRADGKQCKKCGMLEYMNIKEPIQTSGDMIAEKVCEHDWAINSFKEIQCKKCGEVNERPDLIPLEADCIGLCEECERVFDSKEMKKDDKWGHVCKKKNYEVEHRCESYIKTLYPKKAEVISVDELEKVITNSLAGQLIPSKDPYRVTVEEIQEGLRCLRLKLATAIHQELVRRTL